jgi:2-polyprenyl-3-methyl-5-hydroxy-6-metoxy-1,4-benzoquinol methylase
LNIKAQRLSAAISSRGISCDTMYIKFLDLIKDLNLKGACLDFGAGIGNLSQRILTLDQFDIITAADIMKRPVEVPDRINWLTWDLNDSLDLPDASFDSIVSSEVIEHPENPRAAREWFRLLRPNGRLILTTPNNESWRSLLALLVQGHFVAFGDSSYPAHITALLRKDIERILIEAGFSSIKFLFTNFGGIPKMPEQNYQKISFGLLKGMLYSDNIIAVGRKTV